MLINESPRIGPIAAAPSNLILDYTTKYANLHAVRRSGPTELIAIIDTCPLMNAHRYQVIDVKPLRYTRGRSTTIVPGWHLDGECYPRDHDEDAHHLIVFGAARTEFIIGPHEYHENFLADLNRIDYIRWTIPESTWVHYGNRNYHRGPIPDHDGERLLIRITESNRIRPNFKTTERKQQ